MLVYRSKDLKGIVESFLHSCEVARNGVPEEDTKLYGLLTPAQIIAERTGMKNNSVLRAIKSILNGEHEHTTLRKADLLVTVGMGRPDLLASLEVVNIDPSPQGRKAIVHKGLS